MNEISSMGCRVNDHDIKNPFLIVLVAFGFIAVVLALAVPHLILRMTGRQGFFRSSATAYHFRLNGCLDRVR